MLSIKWCHLQWPEVSPNLDFKVMILFNVNWLTRVSDLNCITVANTAISCLPKKKILADINLTPILHTKAWSKFCFYHIQSFRQIRSSLDDAMAASVATALVSSCLDQMNSVLYRTALKHTCTASSVCAGESSVCWRIQRVLASPACAGQSHGESAILSSILF